LHYNGFFVERSLQDKFFARVRKEYISEQRIEITKELVPLACRYFHELFRDMPEAGDSLCVHLRRTVKNHKLGTFGCARAELFPETPSTISTEALAKSFKTSYADCYGNLRRAAEYFRCCSTADTLFYSKSCAIIQSSCSGKTRMVLTLAEHIPTLYICQREAAESSYPPGTPSIVPRFHDNIPDDAVTTGKQDLFMYARCAAFLYVAHSYNATIQQRCTEMGAIR
jgi:hypothetical protein